MAKIKPVYNPRKLGLCTMNYYRNSSSAFGDKMKAYLLSTGQGVCVQCSATDNLTIDHIISVWLAHKYKIDLRELNSFLNFQIMCSACNARKSPNLHEEAVNKLIKSKKPLTINNIMVCGWELSGNE